MGGLILNSRDVTEQVRLQAQLQHDAEHDPLTELANRALLVQAALRPSRDRKRWTTGKRCPALPRAMLVPDAMWGGAALRAP
jgi:hypothetical protein